jgi:hypothetical protein
MNLQCNDPDGIGKGKQGKKVRETARARVWDRVRVIGL